MTAKVTSQSIFNYHKAKTSSDLVMLWYRQNDAVIREADQKAFDRLPADLRRIVNDSPIQLFCPALLLGVRRYGEAVMIAEIERLLAQWMRVSQSQVESLP